MAAVYCELYQMMYYSHCTTAVEDPICLEAMILFCKNPTRKLSKAEDSRSSFVAIVYGSGLFCASRAIRSPANQSSNDTHLANLPRSSHRRAKRQLPTGPASTIMLLATRSLAQL